MLKILKLGKKKGKGAEDGGSVASGGSNASKRSFRSFLSSRSKHSPAGQSEGEGEGLQLSGYVIKNDKALPRFHKHCWRGDLVKLTEDLQKGVDPNTLDKCSRTGLHLAAARGHLKLAEYIVSLGGNIDTRDDKGRTPLLKSVDSGHEQTMMLLLNNGADPNKFDGCGLTALHIAVYRRDLVTVKELLAVGTSMDVKNNIGSTPLHIAALQGNSDMIRHLLQQRADINAVDKEGKTPLMLSAMNGHTAAVKLFVDKRADHRVKCSDGKTALDLAMENRHMACVRMFEGVKSPNPVFGDFNYSSYTSTKDKAPSDEEEPKDQGEEWDSDEESAALPAKGPKLNLSAALRQRLGDGGKSDKMADPPKVVITQESSALPSSIARELSIGSESSFHSTASDLSDDVHPQNDPSKMATASSDPSKMATASSDPSKMATASSDPSKMATASSDPSKMATASSDPSKMATASSDPSKMATASSDPSKMATASSDPSKMATASSDPFKMATASSDPSKMATASSDPSKMATASSDPSKMATASSDPSKMATASSDPSKMAAASNDRMESDFDSTDEDEGEVPIDKSHSYFKQDSHDEEEVGVAEGVVQLNTGSAVEDLMADLLGDQPVTESEFDSEVDLPGDGYVPSIVSQEEGSFKRGVLSPTHSHKSDVMTPPTVATPTVTISPLTAGNFTPFMFNEGDSVGGGAVPDTPTSKGGQPQEGKDVESHDSSWDESDKGEDVSVVKEGVAGVKEGVAGVALGTVAFKTSSKKMQQKGGGGRVDFFSLLSSSSDEEEDHAKGDLPAKEGNKVRQIISDIIQPATATEPAQAETSSNKTGDQVDKTGDKVDKTGDKIDKTGDKVDKTGDKVDKTGDQVNKTGDKVDKTGVQVDKTGDQVDSSLSDEEEESEWEIDIKSSQPVESPHSLEQAVSPSSDKSHLPDHSLARRSPLPPLQRTPSPLQKPEVHLPGHVRTKSPLATTGSSADKKVSFKEETGTDSLEKMEADRSARFQARETELLRAIQKRREKVDATTPTNETTPTNTTTPTNMATPNNVTSPAPEVEPSASNVSSAKDFWEGQSASSRHSVTESSLGKSEQSKISGIFSSLLSSKSPDSHVTNEVTPSFESSEKPISGNDSTILGRRGKEGGRRGKEGGGRDSALTLDDLKTSEQPLKYVLDAGISNHDNSEDNLTPTLTSDSDLEEKEGVAASTPRPSSWSSIRSLQAMSPVLGQGESGHLLQLKDTVQHLNRQLNTSEEGREQVQRKLHKLEDHSTSLKREVLGLLSRKRELEQSKLDYEMKVKTLQHKLEMETDDRVSSEETVAHLKQRLAHLEEEMNSERKNRLTADLKRKELQIEQPVLVSTNQQLERKVKDLVEELTVSCANQKELQQSNDKLQATLELKMEEMLELEAAKDDLLKKVSQQQGALQRVNEELSLQKRESEDAVEQHEKETDALKEELNNKMGELVVMETQMAKSKMQDEVNLTELKGKVEMLSSLSDRYASEKQHLEKEVMELQAKLEASQAKVEQLTSLAADLEKGSHSSATSWIVERSKLEKDLELTRERNQGLVERLESAQRRLDLGESESKSLQSLLTEKSSHISALQHELDQKQINLSVAQDKIDSITEHNSTVVSNLKLEWNSSKTAMETQLRDVKRQVVELEQQLKVAHSEKSSLEQQTMDLKKNLVAMETKTSQVEEDLIQQKQISAALTTDKSVLESKCDHLAQKVLQLESENSKMEDKLKILTLEHTNLDKEHTTTFVKFDTVNVRLKEVLEEASELRQLLAEKDLKVAQLEELHQRAFQQVTETQSLLDRERTSKQKVEGDLREVKSEFAQATQSLKFANQQIENLKYQMEQETEAHTSLEANVRRSHGEAMELQIRLDEMTAKFKEADRMAAESKALWDMEAKSRTKLGLKIKDLESSQSSVNSKVDAERRKVKKAQEMQKSVEIALQVEQVKVKDLENENSSLKTKLKSFRSRIKELQDQVACLPALRAEYEQSCRSAQSELSKVKQQLVATYEQLQREGEVKNEVELLAKSLQQEVDHLSQQIAKSHASKLNKEKEALKLEKGSRKLKEELANYQTYVAENFIDKKDVEVLKNKFQQKAQRELKEKLVDVNAQLQEQANVQFTFEQMRQLSEAEWRQRYQNDTEELKSKINRLQNALECSQLEKEEHLSELKKFKTLYESELKKTGRLSGRLDRARDLTAQSRTKLLLEQNRESLLKSAALSSASRVGQPPSHDSHVTIKASQQLAKDSLYTSVRQELDKSLQRHLDPNRSSVSKWSSQHKTNPLHVSDLTAAKSLHLSSIMDNYKL